MLAVAVLHEQLQQHTACGQHRMGAAMNTESPSLVVGAANPFFTDAASLAEPPATSASTGFLTPTRVLYVPAVIPSS